MNISMPRRNLVIGVLFAAILLMTILAACSSKNDPVVSGQASNEIEEHQKAVFHKVPVAREDHNPNGGSNQRSQAFWGTSGSRQLDEATQRRHQAMVYFSQGDLAKAEPLLIEALKLYENAFEEGRVDQKNQIIREYMEAHRYLYIVYSEKGRHREAEASLNNGIIALAEKFGASDQTINAFSKSIETFQKQQATSQNVKQQVESQYNNSQLESQLEIANKNRVLGNKHFFEKEYDRAEHYFQLVLDYCEQNSDQAPDLCCMAMNDMGALKLGIVQSDDGFTYFESALSLAEKYFHPNHIIIADTSVNIGHYYSSIADYKNALAPYERALRIFVNTYSPNHPSVLQTYFALGAFIPF